MAERRQLRFAAFMGTKDELDILPAAVEHLRRIGVSLIYVFDRGSTDGSLEYLAEAESRGDLWLIRHDPPPHEGNWNVRVELAQTSGADWALFLDSDEFWLPRSGSLHDLPDLDDVDIFSVMRYNVALGADGPMMSAELSPEGYGQTLLYAQPIQRPPAYLREDPEPPFIRIDVDPKVLARPEAVGYLPAGSHEVIPTDTGDWRRAVASEVIVAHVPFRTFERFEQRAMNIREVMDQNPSWGPESHWTRWGQAARQGWVREEYDFQTLRDEDIATERSTGMVRSVAEIYEQLIATPASEADYLVMAKRNQPWVTAAGIVCRRERIQPSGVLRPLITTQRPAVVVPPDRVIKFFGRWADGHAAYEKEMADLGLLGRAPSLPVPHHLASGAFDEEWRYVVHTMIPGRSLRPIRDVVTPESLPGMARWLGRFVRELHALPLTATERAAGQASFREWIGARRDTCARSLREQEGLPARLLEGLDDWLPTVETLVPSSTEVVFTHADLSTEHMIGVAVQGGFEPTGIIGLGQARLGHPMLDFGPVWLDVMRGDRQLLSFFLEEAGLVDTAAADFPKAALAWALLHPAWDPITMPDVQLVATLDELADRAFGSL